MTASARSAETLAAERLMRRATYASVAVALVLIVAKLGAAILTESVSLLSTLLDSMLDFVASLIALIAVRQALVPADREHRFGHGKAEAIAALGQSAFIAGSAIFLIFEVIDRFTNPQPIQHSFVAVGVLVFSIAVTFSLVVFQRHVVRRTSSLAVESDSKHYFGDLLVNVAVIVAILLTAQLGWLYADPVIATGVAAYILWMAVGIAKGALDMLMDRELPDSDRERIKALALADPEIRDAHDLKTRMAGRQCFIQLHLEMDGTLSLKKAHAISAAAERRIREAYPDAEIIVHQDPAGIEEPRQVFSS